MASFEWMELQSLTHDITESRTRLSAARASKDSRLARQLEGEITTAENRRTRLLARITNHLATAPEGGPPVEANTDANEQADAAPAAEAAPPPAAEPVEEPVAEPGGEEPVEEPVAELGDAEPVKAEPQPAEPQSAGPQPAEPQSAEAQQEEPSEVPERVVAAERPAPPAAATQTNAEGDMSVWDKLNASDIERAKQELVTRRAEMLARHAEELRGLDADQTELDTLEQAIGAFLDKFNKSSIVKLDEQRELRKDAS